MAIPTIIVSYAYDALGRRTQRTEASDTTNIHFSAKGDLPDYWSDAAGNITASLVRGPDGLTTFTLDPTSSSPYPCYHLFSPHGDTTMITDAQGASIATSRYDAFGNTIGGVTGLWYGYTGKYERYSDGATGTIQMGVREYDAGLGRFTSVDPLKGDASDPQQRNRYPYTSNNPLVRYDLNGLSAAGDAWGWLNNIMSTKWIGPDDSEGSDNSVSNLINHNDQESHADDFTGFHDNRGCRVGFTTNDERNGILGFEYQYLHDTNTYKIKVMNGHSFEVSPENPFLGAFISDLQHFQTMINMAGIGGIINAAEAFDPSSWLNALSDSNELAQEDLVMIEENKLRLYRDYNQATRWEKSCGGPHYL